MNAANFDSILQGKSVQLFHLHSQYISCFITNYGARVVSLSTMGKDHRMVDVVLGFDSLEGYLNASEKYHGATIGRFANRIADGEFRINDTVYNITKNNNGNSLHGGVNAFHNKIWNCISHEENKLILELDSPHLEEGFPGRLNTKVSFTIEGSTLRIEYEAISSRDTIINLTHHSYFNLNGEGTGSVLNHRILLNSDYYTPVNSNCIPTGSVEMVAYTPFDFTSWKDIGSDIDSDHIQLIHGDGYDHNFVINHHVEGALNYVAKAIGDKSSVQMEVWSTEPGVQFYTANHLDGRDFGKSGVAYYRRTAFCLETQHFPDSPNKSHFPSTFLEENRVFRSSSEYRFSIT